eukprot:12134388-Alexandrium_andersonii.AAC.1
MRVSRLETPRCTDTRCCKAGALRGEPRGEGRSLPSRATRRYPSRRCSPALSRGPVLIGALREEA